MEFCIKEFLNFALLRIYHAIAVFRRHCRPSMTLSKGNFLQFSLFKVDE